MRPIKETQVLMLALLASLLLGASLAATALAEELEYLVGGSPAVSGESLKASGELLLADEKAGITVLCAVETSSEVSSVTDVDVTSAGPGEVLCADQAGCGEPVVKTVHLPWLSELALVGPTLETLLLSAGSGAPGWAIECTNVSGIAEDECTTEPTITVKNEVGIVDESINEQTGSCTRGGANSTLINGLLTLLSATAGLSVEVMGTGSEETAYLTSGNSITVGELFELEGEVLLADHKGGIFGEEVSLLCSSKALAEALSPTDIDITSVYGLEQSDREKARTFNCTNQTGLCSEPAITAKNLPWLLELVLEGSEVKSLLRSGGTGTPGWTVLCESKITTTTDTCTSEPAAETTNEVSGTIDELFNEQTGNCTNGGTGSARTNGLLTLKQKAGLSIEAMP
ncbi:MAG TPA: hypothetical protein VFW38_04315 [Solirubrobacteraceae bacterium]|nr:hypothetical protein [Solirubrobacteraceae bacterium]